MSEITLEGKVVVVGDAGVGKTSLLLAFCRNELGSLTRPNVGVQFFKKSVCIPEEGLTVKLLAWDTAGSERFRSVNALYYRGAAAGILVFDVTSLASFEALPYWLRELRSYSEGVIVVVCGNKADAQAAALRGSTPASTTGPLRRVVSAQVAQEWAKANQCLYLETSAKTGQGVEDVFKGIARAALAQFREGVGATHSASLAGSSAAADGADAAICSAAPVTTGAFRVISVERTGAASSGDTAGGSRGHAQGRDGIRGVPGVSKAQGSSGCC